MSKLYGFGMLLVGFVLGVIAMIIGVVKFFLGVWDGVKEDLEKDARPNTYRVISRDPGKAKPFYMAMGTKDPEPDKKPMFSVWYADWLVKNGINSGEIPWHTPKVMKSSKYEWDENVKSEKVTSSFKINGSPVVFEKSGNASAVIIQLNEWIKENGFVSVAMLCELLNVSAKDIDRELGWCTLKQTEIMSVKGGYCLMVPPTTKLADILLKNKPKRSWKDNFTNIIFASHDEAEGVLISLCDVVDESGVVTVGDFYRFVGVDPEPLDEKWGWTEMKSAMVERVDDGFILLLPKMARLDAH
jgi:hypothetical protein